MLTYTKWRIVLYYWSSYLLSLLNYRECCSRYSLQPVVCNVCCLLCEWSKTALMDTCRLHSLTSPEATGSCHTPGYLHCRFSNLQCYQANYRAPILVNACCLPHHVYRHIMSLVASSPTLLLCRIKCCQFLWQPHRWTHWSAKTSQAVFCRNVCIITWIYICLTVNMAPLWLSFCVLTCSLLFYFYDLSSCTLLRFLARMYM